jgi:predicted RNA binding protein YcfA (HicA-like mRNA interferase family)
MCSELKYSECARILRKNGFVECYQNGSHVRWERNGKHLVIRFSNIKGVIWRRLCKEHHIAK